MSGVTGSQSGGFIVRGSAAHRAAERGNAGLNKG